MHQKLYLIKVLLLLCCPSIAFAQWATYATSEPDGPPGLIAYSDNTEGYRLEIFKDSNSTIKSRFKLRDGLIELRENTCPTFQIDNGMARNHSVDNTPCKLNSNWAEYVIGEIFNNRINSSVLVALMDGITLTFRFQLVSGDYRETSFSLTGSKRSLLTVIGEQITVDEI